MRQQTRELALASVLGALAVLFLALLVSLYRPLPMLRLGAALAACTLAVVGLMNAGSVGPSLMFLMPRCSSESRMQTAFCSYQDRMKDSGRSFTPQSNALASASAIWTAPKASLH